MAQRTWWDRLTGPPDLPEEWGDAELSTGMGPFGGLRNLAGSAGQIAGRGSQMFRSAFDPGTLRNIGRLAGGTAAAGAAAPGVREGAQAAASRPTGSSGRTPSGPPGRPAPHQVARAVAGPERGSASRSRPDVDHSEHPHAGPAPPPGTGPAEVDHSEHPHAGPAQTGDMTLEDLFAMLFGDGDVDTDALGQSFDDQLAALNDAGERFAELTEEQKENIRSSADEAVGNIGGFFDYAAYQAEQGRPVIAESGASTQANLDTIYDDLAANLGAIPGLGQEQATAAAGAGGSQVGERMEAAAAPFRAAGESGRAASKGNVAQHTAAGQDYLSQLAAAAPAEGAMGQQTVEQGAAQATTAADMALAEQQMALELETARLEGAKQRALLEASADTAGSTFDRFMQGAQLFSALGADPAPLREGLGLPAAEGAGMSHEDQLDIALKEQRLADAMAPETEGLEGFYNTPSQQTPTVQREAEELLNIVDSMGWQDDPAQVHQLIDRLTRDDGGGEVTIFGNPKNMPEAESFEDLIEDPEMQRWVPYDPQILRSLFRTLYQ